MADIFPAAFPIFIMRKRRRAGTAQDGVAWRRGGPLPFGSRRGLVVINAIVTIVVLIRRAIGKRGWVFQIQGVISRFPTV